MSLTSIRLYKKIGEYLNDFNPFFYLFQPKVCCAPSITSKINLLPFNICGNIAEDRISHGNKTDINQFPWMAILQYESADGLQQRCGGTLINSRYILTAAHCLNQRDPL